MRATYYSVIAGLDPAIHADVRRVNRKTCAEIRHLGVDKRVRPAYDEEAPSQMMPVAYGAAGSVTMALADWTVSYTVT
jgi:hypothetical protein